MASNTTNIGTKGRMRISVDLVSQDYAANTSIVRVKGDVWLTSGSATDNTGKCYAQFTGTNSTTSIVVKGSYNNKARLILDQTFTVEHDLFGDITVSYTFSFGPTNTKLFGKGGTSGVSLKLPRIPKKPGIPSDLASVLSFPTKITVQYSMPYSDSSIAEYQIRYADNENFSNETIISVGTALSKVIYGLNKDSTYYFMVRARNTIGWSDWSAVVSRYVPNTPDKMAIPLAEFTIPSTLSISFNSPASDGGLTIVEYDVQYSTISDYSQAVTNTITTRSLVLNNITPNSYYIRVRARNLIGESPWSDNRIISTVFGPKIKIGDLQDASTFVYVMGEDNAYHPAITYIRDENNVWRTTGG